jgi:GntR family transcriptional regulator
MDSAGLPGSSALMSEPYYRRIHADIRARIASGEWPPGTKLPSTRELVEFYRGLFGSPTVAPSTVRHAVSLLIELGELRGQQGLGVFVADA